MDILNIFYSDSLVTANALISTSTMMEENQKNVNEIYFSTITKGIYEFDLTQAATLYDIATQCFITGGEAVPIAQALYRLINDTISFNNDTNCAGYSPRLANNSVGYKNSFVYPNPAINSATLQYEFTFNSQGWFIIYDIVGEEKLRLDLTSKINFKKFIALNLVKGFIFIKLWMEKI